MNNSLAFKLLLIFLAFNFVGFAQDDSSESDSDQEEGTTAEASVVSSATAPSTAASGAIESNPIISMLREGRSLAEIKEAIKEFGLVGLQQKARKYGTDKDPNLSEEVLEAQASLSSSLQEAVDALTQEKWFEESYQTALAEAAKLAGELLTDRTITNNDGLPEPINMSSFTSNGYNVAFIHLLSKYGAIGGSSSDSIVTDILGQNLTNGLSENSSLESMNSLFSFLPYLSTYTGGHSLTEDNLPDDLNVPIGNISLSPGNVITIGSTESKSEINVSTLLSSANGNPENFKIHTIGAAKDVIIQGEVLFENENQTEDHALVIAAADNFDLNRETQSKRSKLTYEGSNLALAAGSSSDNSMYIINTEINTGGNLAVGSLGTLNMSTVDLVVGGGGRNSDPDNVYLFASELININGLDFSGGSVNDIYMAAKTITLTNVNFPSSSNVSLNSEFGLPNFDSTTKTGYINFNNVKHGAITLSEDSFASGDYIGTSGSVKLGKL